jgi:hypothetical protein
MARKVTASIAMMKDGRPITVQSIRMFDGGTPDLLKRMLAYRNNAAIFAAHNAARLKK